MIIKKESYGKSKFFCLHCFKSFKSPGDCCGWPLYRISSKARPPKKRAGKTQWRSFFQMFLNGYGANRGQLKRIIEIRSDYGLAIYQQQMNYDEMVEEHEQRFKFLDIKRHEHLFYEGEYDNDEVNTNFIKAINALVLSFDVKKTAKKFKLNKKYFMVPIHAQEGYGNVFPSKLDKYKIYKVAVSYKDSTKKHAFKILTNNVDETYTEYQSSIFSNTQYSFRQGFLIFDTKEKAMAFRFKYLRILGEYFKNNKKPLFKDLMKEANSDYKRVSRRSPELLI